MVKIIFSFFFLLLIISKCTESSGQDSIVNPPEPTEEPAVNELYELYCSRAETSFDADTVLKYSELAIEISDKSGGSASKAWALMGKGHLLAGRHSRAVECYIKAAQIYESENNMVGLAKVYTYLSNAYSSQQNHDNAKLYLRKAIKILEIEGDSITLASSLHNLAYEYYRVENYDSALILFDHAGQVYKRLDQIFGDAYCIGNSGLVYSKLEQFEKAEENLLIAIDILGDFGDERAIADFSNEYAYVLQRKGKMNEAIVASHRGLELANRNNITELKRDATFRLANIYTELKRYDSALYYQQQYHAYNDSIRNLETIQKIADQTTEYEVSRKQAEVDILEKNRQLQRTIIGGLIIIILLAGGLIVLIYLSLKRNRKLTKALEEQKIKLEVQSKELQQLNHIKDRFFSIISHDLRSPIASLSGISFLLKESRESDNEALLNQAVDYIDQSVLSLTGLLENLLNWALSQQGRFPYKEENIDLEELIQEVVKMFATVALSKDQTIHLDLESGILVSADRNTMMTIIRNLLSNATKFTPKGGTISIGLEKKGKDNAEIVVSDTGTGIPEEKLADLFKLKEDKSSRGTENEKGLGLGLNLVHEFVTTNRGTIRAESKVGEGTSFFLNFPRVNK